MTIEYWLLTYLLWLLSLGCLQRRGQGCRSIVSGTVGAILGSRAQRQANQVNRQNVIDQNTLQQELFHQARGSGGSAILPEYFGPFEQRLANDTVGAYDAANTAYGTPAERIAAGQAIAGKYQPLFDQGTNLLSSLYGGGLQDKLTSEYAPVAAATSALARTKRQGIFQGLQQRLAALSASNAAKGFVGSGSAEQNAALRATVGANQDAAGAVAGADLQNQLGLQSIRDRILAAQFGNLDTTANRAQQAISLANLPEQYLASTYAQQTAPFNFFRLQTGNPPALNPQPYVSPNVGAGQAFAAAAQQGGGALLDYWLKSQQAKQYAGLFSPNTGGSTGLFAEGAGGGGIDWASLGASGGFSGE